MAGRLSVRNLDEDVIAGLKRRAVCHGQSTEAKARDILGQALEGEIDTVFYRLAAEMRQLTAGRHHTPSEVLAREGRSER